MPEQESGPDGGGAMRIKGVPLEQAAPNVQRLYRKTAEALGRVTIPLTAFAHCPEVAEAYSALAGALMRSSGVEPRLKTLACVRAAQIAGCPF
jgi:alkylhydroperoxidase family enzyme